jgi:hypothetical protein
MEPIPPGNRTAYVLIALSVAFITLVVLLSVAGCRSMRRECIRTINGEVCASADVKDLRCVRTIDGRTRAVWDELGLGGQWQRRTDLAECKPEVD